MRCVRFVDGKGKRMSNARQGSVSHKFFEMVEAHKEDLAELHLRREIERMVDELEAKIAYNGARSVKKYTLEIQEARGVLKFGPYTLQQCHDKLREISNDT
jgi:hypothetical protein